MALISFKKFVTKGYFAQLLNSLSGSLQCVPEITDVDGVVLWGQPTEGEPLPITTGEQFWGHVRAPAPHGRIFADLTAHYLQRELDRRILAAEALEKYREITFLYAFSGKIASCLGIREVCQLVIAEAHKLIPSTSAMVMLYQEADHRLEMIASISPSTTPPLSLSPTQGIEGHVFTSGRAEIVNHVSADPRHDSSYPTDYALICAPLKTQDRVMGIIRIGTSEQIHYTAAELKLFTALTAQASAAIENALLHEHKIREERIKSNLERYLSPQVAQTVISATGEISLTTSKRRLTMLFSDIRNFSSHCEELDAEDMVTYLNEYFTHMVSVIFSHRGTVNKFVGDMIVAMFGAPATLPNHEQRAIAAAIDMQRCLAKIPVPWIQQHFLTGIGISTGEVVVGNIGSPQHMDYTAIGDEVNVAARLQGLAKGGQILVSRSVYDAARSNYTFRPYGDIVVKGRKNPVEIYEVIYT
ncbi:MAG: GAF domain-containing protein [Oscillatoriales cyanobacterium SM2_2_1]|nr:GAF domain-containing protein [Oscillatoriales cyanobacterium SM2_2_1]